MLSVVVPMFNEEERLAAGLAGLAELRGLADTEIEAILVDDGSRDGSLAAARAARGVRVLGEPHRGKGGALRAGVAAATGDRVLVADIDWSVAPAQALELVATDADVVIASREGAGSRRVGEPLWRHWMGRIFNHAVQDVLAGLDDTQCGFKAFSARAAHALFPRLTIEGWAWDVEILYLAHLEGWSVQEVPVVWRYEADSRLRPLRDAVAMLRDVRRIRRNARAGAYRTMR